MEIVFFLMLKALAPKLVPARITQSSSGMLHFSESLNAQVKSRVDACRGPHMNYESNPRRLYFKLSFIGFAGSYTLGFRVTRSDTPLRSEYTGPLF